MMRSACFRWLVIPIIASLNTVYSYSQLYINEILTANVTINPDPQYRNYGDWIEIYNAGSSGIDLINYSITDDIADPEKYKFLYSAYIGAQSYALVWADGYNSWMHTNFSLDNDGEYIALISPDGTIIDSITYKPQIPDVSYGRAPDCSNNWVYFAEPTPAGSNNATGITSLVQAPDVSFSLSPGFYASAQTVAISSSLPTATIRYTTDGSIPDDDSPVYSSAVQISSTTVLKARCYESGYLPGNIGASTYFINESFDIPVVSISTDPYYFFDWSWGIYVVGENGAPGCGDTANFYQDWERPLNFEYFEINGERKVNKMVGTKIIGSCTRRWRSKSLTLISREKYGEKGLNHRFFSDKNISSFKSLNLRNSGNDFYETMLRDGFMQNLLIGRMDIDYQSYQPAIVFLNGEYWGILNLREKLNEHYVESNYGIDADDVSVLENNAEIVNGTADHYNDLLDFINSNDLSIQTNFDHVNTQMEVSEYLDYYILNTFVGNEDWPHNNIRYWRENNATSRWRWMLFDTDYGFGLFDYYDGQNLADMSYTDWSHDLIRGLMENQNFKNEFIQRFAAHLNTTFEPYRVIGILDSLAAIIDSKMSRHIDKWESLPSYSSWLGFLEEMRTYAHDRVPDMRNQIVDYFDITGTYQLENSVSVSNSGKILLCEVDITNAAAGQYFDNIPVRLEAIPEAGYVFKGWTGDTISTTNPISLTFSSDVFIQANFEEDDIPDINNIYINEFAANDTWVTDDHGETEDWIEIYNANDFAVDIGGLYVSDLIDDPLRCQITKDSPELTTIPAYGYLVLWADNEPEQGVLHLNLKLDKDGEQLSLVQRRAGSNAYLDSVHFNEQFVNTTYGHNPDGNHSWSYMIPSPGATNTSSCTPVSGIFINEFSTENDSIIADENGEYDDWIEIYNSNDEPVDIGGLFITDSINNPAKYRIPVTYPDSTTIPAHGYLILWADGQKKQGILHLDFKLARNGEEIGLAQCDGSAYIDSLIYGEQYANSSSSRYPDGSTEWLFVPPTPGSSNTLPVISGLFINEFSASNSDIICDGNGDFDDWIEIFNSTDEDVDIGGLFMTDNLYEPTKDRIPSTNPGLTTIPAHGYIILWADDEEVQGILHLDFNLSKNGEFIGLAGYDGGKYIDSLVYGEQSANSSLSRYPDGNATWISAPPTPGSTNTIPVILSCEADGTNNLRFTIAEMPGYSAFNVYRDTIAYFLPDKTGGTNRIAGNVTDQDPVEEGVQWTDNGVLGDPGTNYFYIFTGVGAGESANSVTMGEFDYQLIITSTTDFNEIALPIKIDGITNASDLMAAIPGCNSIARWDAAEQGYYQYVSFLPVTNFEIEKGYPYYVNVTDNIIFTLIGEVVRPVFNLIITPTTDFNEIMLTLDKNDITQASGLMADIPSCNSIARWDAEEQGYYQYVSFLPTTNFSVRVGYPYYVNVESNVTWPEPGVGEGYLKSTSYHSGVRVNIEKSNAPHLVYGTIKTDDLNIDESGIGLCAYISSLPEEKLNIKSTGCMIRDGYWMVQCNTFPSGWKAGEKVIVEFSDNTGNILAEAEVELTFKPADKATDIIISGNRAFSLSQNMPNPFTDQTLIQYQIPEYGPVQVDVYSITGQKVRTLVSQYQDEGVYEVIWNRKDDSGYELQAGIYIYILKSRDQIIVRKALIIK